MERLLTVILKYVHRLWRYANTNPRLRKILYRASNSNEFDDLSQHERMLADQVRVTAYHTAIKKHVSQEDVVIDLGTGTGILAFFASQQNPKKIHAIDHSSTIEIAEYLSSKNSISNIEFHKTHSSKLSKDIRASIIIHEQIGDFLFEEDMINNISELRDRFLLPDGKILPNKFELFFEPVQLNDDRRTPYLWENNLYGVCFSSAKEWLSAHKQKGKSTAAWHSIRLSPGDVASFNCNPESVMSFDLLTVEPKSLPKVLNFRKKIVEAGPMDGFCLYFKVIFDEEIEFETSPLAKPTHWASQLFRIERAHLMEGDVIAVELYMGDHTNCRTWSVKYSLEARNSSPTSALEQHNL